jgi:hypothetical protein
MTETESDYNRVMSPSIRHAILVTVCWTTKSDNGKNSCVELDCLHC